VTAFSVPEGSLGAWQERLSRHGVVAESPKSRGEEEVLTLLDPDGLKLELVAHAGAADEAPWSEGPVPEAQAIRRFFGMTLTEPAYAPTAETLATLGFPLLGESQGAENRFRFDAGRGARLDVVPQPGGSYGHIAAGTVHHVAWRVADDAEQRLWREKVASAGLSVTPVLDRQYFHSIYFREPGGVLFEIATDPPGFTFDESVESLGSALKLPPWLEGDRERIARRLPRLEADGVVTGGGAP
jgi:glyoxalase family protein